MTVITRCLRKEKEGFLESVRLSIKPIKIKMDSFLQVYHYVNKNDLISTILIDFNPLIANVLTMTLVRKKFIRFNLR